VKTLPVTLEDASGESRLSSMWRWRAGGRCRRCRDGGSQRRFLRRRDRRRHLRSDPWLFGFDGLSSPLVWGHGRGPFSSSVCPEAIVVAVLPPETEVVAALLVERSPTSHLEFVVPQALWCGGCSYPREWNRSSVCNGTLSMGVCSLWLSRPEHLCNIPKNVAKGLSSVRGCGERVVGRWMQSQETSDASFLFPTKP
jgi:hypothetical protein